MKVKTALNVEKQLYEAFKRKAQDNGLPISWLLERALDDALQLDDDQFIKEYLKC